VIGLGDKLDLIGGREGEGNRETLVFRGVYCLNTFSLTDKKSGFVVGMIEFKTGCPLPTWHQLA